MEGLVYHIFNQYYVSLVADLEKCKEGLENKAKYQSGGHQTLSHNYMAHTYVYFDAR